MLLQQINDKTINELKNKKINYNEISFNLIKKIETDILKLIDYDNLTIKDIKILITLKDDLDILIVNKMFKDNKFKNEEMDDFTNFLIKEEIRNKNSAKKIVMCDFIDFNEENIKKLIPFYDLFFMLKNQKEIDFILKNIMFYLNNDKKYETIKPLDVLLYNNKYFDFEKMKKILEINMPLNENGICLTTFPQKLKEETFNNEYFKELTISNITQILNLIENVDFDDEMIKKYPLIYTKERILKHKYTTIEKIEKHFSYDEIDLNIVNKNVGFNKQFLIKQFSKIKDSDNFSNDFFYFAKTKKEVEFIFISLVQKILKDKYVKFKIEEIEERLINLNIAFNFDFDFDFYENLIKKSNILIKEIIEDSDAIINLNLLETTYLFNKNTSEKHYKKLEKLLKKPENLNDTKILENTNNEVIKSFEYLKKVCNVPDYFLTKYFTYFIYDFNNSTHKYNKSFKMLLMKQKLSKELKEILISSNLMETKDIITYVEYQIEDKKEFEDLKKIIKSNYPKENPEYLDSYFFDLVKNNPNYIKSLNKKELIELFDKNKIENEEIYQMLPILIYNLEEQKRTKEKQMSEIFKNIKNEISFS